MLGRVVWEKFADVAEVLAASIIRTIIALYALSLSAVFFQYYEEHQYPIRGLLPSSNLVPFYAFLLYAAIHRNATPRIKRVT
jgi:hypothetical protein